MPFAEWYLSPWGNRPDSARVQIDPAEVWGCRGAFGPMLVLPYKLPKGEGSSASLELLALEGWIGLGNVTESDARLPIPSQIVWPAPQYRLQVPLTDAQIEAIEQIRNGGQVNLTVWLGGVASGDQGVLAVQSTNSSWLTIERERWLAVLQRLGAGTRRLVELPEPRLPRGEHPWAECMRLLDGATQLHRNGEYEHALANCRQIVEGIPQVLGTVWGLQLPRNGQPPFAVWIQGLETQLRDAWPEDRLTSGMLQTMIAGAWRWLAPTPHYGTGIPMREDVAFALGLCTDLLQFAGQVLQAHPVPIVRQREETV